MEEEQLELLKANGFSYDNTYGVITDSNGAYVDNAQIGDQNFTSSVEESRYSELVQEDKDLAEQGFAMQDNGLSRDAQVSEFKSMKNIDAFLDDPVANYIPPGERQDPPAAYSGQQEERRINGEEYYPSLDAQYSAVKEQELDPLVGELSEEDQEKYAAEIKKQKNIINQDPDNKSITKAMAMASKGLEDKALPFAMHVPGLGELRTDLINTVANFFSDGSGMDDEELKKQYVESKKKEREIITPAIQARQELMDLQKEEVDSMLKREDLSVSEKIMLENSKMSIDAQLKRVDDFYNQRNYDTSIFTKEKAADILSMGFYEAGSSMSLLVPIVNKIEAGEELTEAEELYLGTYKSTEELNGTLSQYQTNWHAITGGAVESLTFLAGGSVGRALGKTAARGVSKFAAKKGASSLLSQAASITTNLGVQGATHSSTYSTAASEYSGNVQMQEVRDIEGKLTGFKFLTNEKTYQEAKEQYELALEDAEDKLFEAQNSGDKEAQKDIQGVIDSLEEGFGRLEKVDRKSMGSSLAKGFTETVKEAMIEQAGYSGFKNGAKFIKNKVPAKYRRFMPEMGSSRMTYAINKSNAAANRLLGEGAVKGQRVIGGLGEELFEEEIMQLLPTYGDSWEDYKEQVGELSDISFHLRVLGQTALMQGGFNSVGAASRGINTLNKMRTKEGRADIKASKELNKIYEEMSKRGISEKDFDKAFIKTGEGKFSITAYNNQIAALKKTGNLAEATQLQKDLLFKQAMAAVEKGHINEFSKMLKSAKYNKNLSPEYQAALAEMQGVVNELQEDSQKYVNSKDIAKLKSNKRFSQQTVKDIDKRLNSLDRAKATEGLNKAAGTEGKTVEELLNNTELREKLDKSTGLSREFANLVMNKAVLTENIENMDSSLSTLTSFNHQTMLQTENAYQKALLKLTRKIGKGTSTQESLNQAIEVLSNKRIAKEVFNDRRDHINNSIREIVETNDQKRSLANLLNAQQEQYQASLEKGDSPETLVSPESLIGAMSAMQGVMGANAAMSSPEVDESLFEDASQESIAQVQAEMRNFADAFADVNDAQPTLEDYFKQFLKLDGVSLDDFNKEFIEGLGMYWNDSGLPKSDWKALYRDYYGAPKLERAASAGLSLMNSIVTQADTNSQETNVESSEANIEEVKKIEEQAESVVGTNPSTGQDIKAETEAGKTSVVNPTIGFSGTKYVEVRRNGKVERSDKVESNDEIVGLNLEGTAIDVKATLSPDNLNPGDNVDTEILDESEWISADVLVGEYDAIGFKEYSTFQEWFDSKTEGMTDAQKEDFKNSDAFIDKVPIFYKDSKGRRVGYVRDPQWYNESNISIKIDGEVDPVATEKAIEEGRRQAIETRKAIADGRISSIKVKSKRGQVVTSIPKDLPAKSLSEVAQNNLIANISSGSSEATFYIGDKKVVATVDSEFEVEGQKYQLDSTPLYGDNVTSNRRHNFYFSPTYRENGVQHGVMLRILRKDEGGVKNTANSNDITTFHYILAAHKILNPIKTKTSEQVATELSSISPEFAMTVDQAKELNEQFKEDVGFSLADYNKVLNYVNSSLAIESLGQKPTTFYAGATGIGSQKVDFITAFLNRNRLGYNPIQNTSLKADEAPVTISRDTEGKFKIEENGKYEDYLRSRMHTNIMGYNVGTRENPEFITFIQPSIELEVEFKESTEKKIEPRNQVREELSQETKENISEEQEVSLEEMIAHLEKLNMAGDLYQSFDTDELPIVDVANRVTNIEESLNIIPGMSISNQQHLVQVILGEISRKEKDFKDKSKSSIRKEIKDYYNNLFESNRKANESYLEKVSQLLALNPKDSKILAVKSKLEAAQVSLDSSLDNFDTLYEKSIEEAEKANFLRDSLSEDTEDTIGPDNFYMSSNEVIHKEKISSTLKKIFSTIPDGNSGFLGTPSYENFDDIFNKVSMFLCSPLPPNPNFDSMVDRLENLYDEANPSVNQWVKPLIKELKNTDKDTKASFVSAMYKYNRNARFIMFTKSKDGVETGVWFSNANNIQQKIKVAWDNNFVTGRITEGDLIDKDVLSELADKYEALGTEPWKAEDQLLRDWLSDFGITISDGTWDYLKKNGMTVGKKSIGFSKMFAPTKQRGSALFHSLYLYAKSNSSKEGDLKFTSDKELYPTKDMNNVIKGLLKVESMYNTSLVSISSRDGDKTVSEIVQPSYYLNEIRKLKLAANSKDASEREILDQLRQSPFSSSSYMLNLLMKEDGKLSEVLDFAEVAIMSMRDQDASKPDNASVEDLSPIDHMFAVRGFFQDMKQESTDNTIVKTDKEGLRSPGSIFGLRTVHLPTPTNSDKGRMMLMKTFGFDLYHSPDAFAISPEGEVELSSDVTKLMYDQLVLPELRRILNSGKGAKDISAYSKGSQRFNLIPALNLLASKDGMKAIDYLSSKEATEEGFKDKFGTEARELFSKMVLTEAKQNLYMSGNLSDNTDVINNQEYLKNPGLSKSTTMQKKFMAEADFIINSMIGTMNTLQLVTGDPAFFYKGKGSPTSSNMSEQQALSESTSVNIGKRMAMMIAPGASLSDSTNSQGKPEQYIQLFLQDQEETAANAEYLVKLHYGEDMLSEIPEGFSKSYGQMLENLRKNDGSITDSEVAQLKFAFANIKDFLFIESTDAQEYTTLAEHLRVLRGQGKITNEQEQEILSKKDDPNLLQDPIMKEVILQPVKPVYTGKVYDKASGIFIPTYVKSSSFPLIPQLLEGSSLLPFAQKMEQLEKESGMNVRAAYGTAVKVGFTNTPIDINDASQVEQITSAKSDPESSSIMYNQGRVLNRTDFKIQQVVPFKAGKQGEDKVSMGTQIFKLLFGDGILDIPNISVDSNGNDISGQELYAKFNNAFSTMIDNQKTNLLESLGLDEDFTTFSPEDAANKLKDLLVSEAKERGFSENDIKSLDLVEKEFNGTKSYQFMLPIWMSANSNKFEAMLNAIINNKIFKQKLPGNAYVVGSEAGITRTQEWKEGDSNDILLLGDYKGGELGPNQVLAPSRIKVNGELVDLYKKDRRGEYIYLKEQEDGRLVLNETRVDKSLLENFSFRTPTSSHGSGGMYEVVGVLPKTMGDLMITPKNFIPQMGQDFDVDKLTAYQYHHYVDAKGNIKKLDADAYKSKIEQAERELKEKSDDVHNSVDTLIAAIFGEEISKEGKELDNLEAEQKIGRIKRELETKLAQNDFIEVHNQIYKSENKEVQRKINKVLSMEFAENQAEAIDSEVASNVGGHNFLSPKYQMDKLISGSTGAMAIGIYAKGVTFNSLLQQLPDDKKVSMKLAEGITIGNVTSNGVLGNPMAIVPKYAGEFERSMARSTTQIMDERVNTATDNEKAQILGRTGITHRDAISVDNMLSLLGIDREINTVTQEEYEENLGNKFYKKAMYKGRSIFYKEYSLPYLLSSQPIVKEYFRRLKNARGITSDPIINAEQTIFEDLVSGLPDTLPEGIGENLTGENMASSLNESIYSDNQKMTLVIYKDLIEKAKGIKELQDVVDMSNLGKSMWELKDKIDKFQDFISVNSEIGDKFNNPLSLLGEVENGQFIPTTNQGKMVGTAIDLGENLFLKMFPFYNDTIATSINSIVENTQRKGDNIKLKEKIFEEMKKFLTSNTNLGIYSVDSDTARKELFYSNGINTSLSNYIGTNLRSVAEESDYYMGIKSLQENKLITSMEYSPGVDGKPDLIKFDNSEASRTSEEVFFNAFKELMVQNLPLPPKNGQPYTTRMLAQEMVAYSYLSGGIVRGAIEFHRFIPIEYYSDVVNSEGVSALDGLQQYDTSVYGTTKIGSVAFNFETQFFQNNPDLSVRVSSKDDNISETDSGKLFVYGDYVESLPDFLHTKSYNKKGQKNTQYNLYKKTGEGIYEKIDTVGDFGMAEYNLNKSQSKSSMPLSEEVSLTEKGKIVVDNSFPASTPITDDTITIKEGDSVEETLDRIISSNVSLNPALAETAQIIKDMFPGLNSRLTLKIDNNMSALGRYVNNVISINQVAHGKDNSTSESRTFVHELIHGVTSDYMNNFIDRSTNEVDWSNPALNQNPRLAKDVEALVNVYELYDKHVKETYKEEYETFYKKWNTYKENKTRAMNNLPALPVDKFTPRERAVFYPTVNLKEFLAVSLDGNVQMLDEAKKVKFSGKINILDKFKKVLGRILDTISKDLGGNLEKGSTLANAILTTNLNFINTISQEGTREVKDEVPPQQVSSEDMKNITDITNNPFDFGDENISASNSVLPEVSLYNEILKTKDC